MRVLKESWLEAYKRYTINTEAPTQFHFWTGVVTIAAALQRKVWIDLGHFQWVPNFFCLLVGEPGLVTKSTSIRIGRNLLDGVPGFREGPHSLTWQSLIDAFMEAQQGFEIIMEDGTKGQLVNAPLTMFIAELGNLLDPKNREMIDLLTDMWDGQATGFKRRTRASGELEIKNPFLNFIGCTTPSWIAANVAPEMVGGGFTSRLIVIQGDKKKHLIAYPGISSGGLEHELEEGLVNDLKHIARLVGPMSLSADALEWGEEWYHLLHTRPKVRFDKASDGFFARKQTHLHKLAMILSIAEGDSMTVSKKHLIAADLMIKEVEAQMLHVFGNITGRGAKQRYTLDIEHLLSRGLECSEGELFSLLVNTMSKDEFDKGIKDLTAANRIYVSVRSGKPVLKYRKRPSSPS